MYYNDLPNIESTIPPIAKIKRILPVILFNIHKPRTLNLFLNLPTNKVRISQQILATNNLEKIPIALYINGASGFKNWNLAKSTLKRNMIKGLHIPSQKQVI